MEQISPVLERRENGREGVKEKTYLKTLGPPRSWFGGGRRSYVETTWGLDQARAGPLAPPMELGQRVYRHRALAPGRSPRCPPPKVEKRSVRGERR